MSCICSLSELGTRYIITEIAVLKRRLNFVPLPEPEPLHTNYRGPLPGMKPLLHQKAPVTPEPLVITRGLKIKD